MKNRRIEALYCKYRKAKLASWRKDKSGFCEIYHCYQEPKELSYWDDTAFMVGKKRVVVTWIHPRLKYSDKCEDLAWAEVPEDTGSSSAWLDASTPRYKKVGKSRKKVVSWLCAGLDQATKDKYAVYRETRSVVLETSDYVAVPHLRFEYWNHALNMNICAPLEVRSEADVVELAKLCKELYLNRELFSQKFGSYGYGKDDWVREHSGKPEPLEASSHPVA